MVRDMTAWPKCSAALMNLIKSQAGVIARWQAIAAGMSHGTIDRLIASGSWRSVHHGVYATFTGDLSREARMWAALLYCGRNPQRRVTGTLDAALSHETAAALWGIGSTASRDIHVTILSGRRKPAAADGIKIHFSGRLRAARHPVKSPPRTRVEDTVLDLAETAPTLDQAIQWMSLACGERRTTPERLATALSARNRIRWRDELRYALGDVADGAQNIFEIRYYRLVERAHGLPRGTRQLRRRGQSGSIYDDVVYQVPRQGGGDTIVHLDGRVHEHQTRFRDAQRDNEATIRGDDTLRFGWNDVVERPCELAGYVAAVLNRNGGAITLRPCGPGCDVGLASVEHAA